MAKEGSLGPSQRFTKLRVCECADVPKRGTQLPLAAAQEPLERVSGRLPSERSFLL